jgi:phosphoribosylanthranilate isomerase
MTWVKICGITNLEDALTAVDAGADALGFVFYEKSPRYVGPEAAREIIKQLPEGVERVAVFAKASADEVTAMAMSSGTTAAQVYVDVEAPEGGAECAYCFEQLPRRNPPIKLIPVLSMQRERPEGPAMMWNPDAIHAFLLDSSSDGQPGGTGRPFDWAAKEPATKVIKSLANMIIAGGLTETNVAEAMHILKPWGVDVSSGVEADPGRKDPQKVRAFIRAVRQADKGT